MNKKHLRILDRLFEHPTRSDGEWNEAMGALKALGAVITEGKGSAVRVRLNEVRAVFHKPHPRKEMGKYLVEDIRDFIVSSGVTWK